MMLKIERFDNLIMILDFILMNIDFILMNSESVTLQKYEFVELVDLAVIADYN